MIELTEKGGGHRSGAHGPACLGRDRVAAGAGGTVLPSGSKATKIRQSGWPVCSQSVADWDIC